MPFKATWVVQVQTTATKTLPPAEAGGAGIAKTRPPGFSPPGTWACMYRLLYGVSFLPSFLPVCQPGITKLWMAQ